MPQYLVWLFKNAAIPMEANDGNGNDLPGGNSPTGGDHDDKSGQEVEKPAGDKANGDDGDDNKDAKSALSDAEAKLLRDVMKHKNRSRELEEKLNAITGVLGDMTPDDVAALIAERKENERKELEKRGEYERILEQVKTEHERSTQSLRQQIDSLKSALNEKDAVIEEMTVGRAFSESAFIRDKSLIPASIARKEFGPHIDLVDGQIVVYDKPRGADSRTPLVDADGNYKKFDEAIAQLYAAHPDSKVLMRAQAKPGAGSGSDDPGVRKPQKTEVASGVGRIAHALGKKDQ